MEGQLPLNYLFAETLEAGADIGDVNILAPGLFTFSGWLSAGHCELWKLRGDVCWSSFICMIDNL